MPFEMDAEEVRRMSREERAKYNAEVEERHIRFSETAPVQSPFDEARLPGNEWARYPYIGLSSAVHTEFRAKIPQGENFCVTVIMAEPGRGAPLHAHTTEEIIALTGRWGIFWGTKLSTRCSWSRGTPSRCRPRRCAASATPGPRMRSCSASSAVATPTADLPLSVTQQVDEWHGRAPARPAIQPIPAR